MQKLEQINGIINFFTNITRVQVIDLLIAFVIIGVFVILSPALSYLIIKMFKFREKDKKKIKENPFYLPLKALFICIGVYFGILVINPPANVIKICKQVFDIAIICILAKGLVNFVDPKKGIVRKMRNDDMPDGNRTVASFTGKILKYAIYIGAGLLILAVWGINPSSLIAGLGIGSAVVALAAQDFVKNLISGFSILSDRPFLVGDWIQVGNNEGRVMEISFRTTKIKTADNTIITIQNSIFNTDIVINWSRMQERRYLLNIKLPLNTNSDKVEKIINRIKFVLMNENDVIEDTIQVSLDTIDTTGMNLLIYMYTANVEYVSYLSFRTKVNEKILKVLESENINMSYPGQNVYVHQVDEEDLNVINKENI